MSLSDDQSSVHVPSATIENGLLPQRHNTPPLEGVTVSPREGEVPDTSLGDTISLDDHEVEDEKLAEEFGESNVKEIERDLDTLSYSGATINDLEIQLSHVKELYRKTLIEFRTKVDTLRRKLRTSISKSDPFIELWRQARQAQDYSNKAAARFDKANSQHAAAKEMIRVAESQLEARKIEQLKLEDPSSPSPLDLAWQEMLNHATDKVVLTERDRRDAELEHGRAMDHCHKVMEQYKMTERKLRSHIIKSRPFYEERYRANQCLLQLKARIKDLESKINDSKAAYSSTLRRLEVLNTEMHERRATMSQHDPRQTASTGNTPELRRMRLRTHSGMGDSVSLDSLQLVDTRPQFSGSTGSLPSIGTSSVSENSLTPDPGSESCPTPNSEDNINTGGNSSKSSSPVEENPVISGIDIRITVEGENCDDPVEETAAVTGEVPVGKSDIEQDSVQKLASELVSKCVTSAVNLVESSKSTCHS